MSLRVWLPLTKDLRNQGLDNVTITNNGATFNSAGKLGGCYYFNRSIPNYLKITNPLTTATNGVSMAFWVKLPSNGSVNDQLVHIGNGSGWTNNRFTCFVRGGASTLIFSCGDGTSNTNYNCTSSALTLNQWTHVICLYENSKMKIYLDGVLDKEYSTTIIPSFTNVAYIGIGAGPNITEPATAYLNDVRIYDHALSEMEIKQLSQGLVLHYPLSNNSIQQLNNCYNYPTFNTSSASGGWSHWGQSGASGSYGQTTDSQYIYRKGQSYAHWFANAAGATGDYLLYQSPAFDGGKRSVQCICKEENGLPIEESIVRPVWNARSGGAINGKWTSIISLDNDFYYCKCENIQQSGSDDLVGFYIKPGYKVYFSEAYLEDNRDVSSDIFSSTNVVYDCSGFCNNGTINGDLIISADISKYKLSTYFDNDISDTTNPSQKIYITNEDIGLKSMSQFTIAAWFKQINFNRGGKVTTSAPTSTIDYTTSGVDDYDAQIHFRTTDNNVVTISGFYNKANEWDHIVFTFDGINAKEYLNGELKETKSFSSTKTIDISHLTIGASNAGGVSRCYEGYVSDYRIYATALSANDVLSLYQNSAYIDSSGNIYGKIRE